MPVLIAGVFSVLALWLGHSVYVLGQVSVYAENGLMENIQAGTLVICGVLFLLTALQRHRHDKLVAVFLSLLCLGFFLREIDVERFDIPHIFILLGSGAGRNIIMAASFVLVAAYGLMKFGYYKTLIKPFLLSAKGLWLVIAGLMLVTGAIFEKTEAVSHYVFLEELMEMAGYTGILLAAIVLLKQPVTTTSEDHLPNKAGELSSI